MDVLGVLTGVFEGLSGIVNKPLSGAEQDGLRGFARGLLRVRNQLSRRCNDMIFDCLRLA